MESSTVSHQLRLLRHLGLSSASATVAASSMQGEPPRSDIGCLSSLPLCAIAQVRPRQARRLPSSFARARRASAERPDSKERRDSQRVPADHGSQARRQHARRTDERSGARRAPRASRYWTDRANILVLERNDHGRATEGRSRWCEVGDRGPHIGRSAHPATPARRSVRPRSAVAILAVIRSVIRRTPPPNTAAWMPLRFAHRPSSFDRANRRRARRRRRRAAWSRSFAAARGRCATRGRWRTPGRPLGGRPPSVTSHSVV
jgi:hypothetical protein